MLYRTDGHQESKTSNGDATRFDNYGILLVTEVTSTQIYNVQETQR